MELNITCTMNESGTIDFSQCGCHIEFYVDENEAVNSFTVNNKVLDHVILKTHIFQNCFL